MEETEAKKPEEKKRGQNGRPRADRGLKLGPSVQVKRLHRRSGSKLSLRKFVARNPSGLTAQWFKNKGE